MRVLIAVAGLMLLAGAAWASTIWSVYFAGGRTEVLAAHPDEDIETFDLGSGIYVLHGAGGNVTVLTGPEGLLVIDTGLPRTSTKLADALAAISDDPVMHIINTHSHSDHAGGNAEIANDETQIFAHAAARTELRKQVGSLFTQGDLPTVVFEERHSFEFNGQEIHLIHVPGAHSNNDVVVTIQPANVIASGDAFMTTALPYLAVEQGASLDGHLSAQSILLALADENTRIVPGHGDISDRNDLVEVNEDLRNIRERLAWLKDMGVPRVARVFFHPLRGWPEERLTEGDWEKYWTSLAWDSLP